MIFLQLVFLGKNVCVCSVECVWRVAGGTWKERNILDCLLRGHFVRWAFIIVIIVGTVCTFISALIIKLVWT